MALNTKRPECVQLPLSCMGGWRDNTDVWKRWMEKKKAQIQKLPLPFPEVIVLSSPAPERIRKSIYLFELLHCQATDTAEEFIIRKP